MAITCSVDTITFNDGTTQTQAFCTSCMISFCTNPVNINFGSASVPAFTATSAIAAGASTICSHNLTSTTSFYRQGTGASACINFDVSSSTKRTYFASCVVQRQNITPSTTNTLNLGSTGLRWSTLWIAGGSVTNVSDENHKTDIMPISDQERSVALELQKNLKRFKFKDAVTEKGFEEARYHLGCIAQEVAQIFRDKGLDPFKYGMIGYDIWYEGINPDTQDFERVDTPADGYVKKDLYSIRYSELLSFIVAAM
jgi:hypothetical protein